MKEEPQEPTKAQLEILQILWQYGPSTVRFVNEQLNQQKQALSYTSTLKLMQIMHEKGMLLRDESAMTHVYSPTLEEKSTKNVVLGKFLDSMYNGSVKSMMLELLGHEKTTTQEWESIRKMLQDLKDDPS